MTTKAVQLRRGTAQEHEVFTGLDGEITYDKTNRALRVHDGITAGGLLRPGRSTAMPLNSRSSARCRRLGQGSGP